MPQLAPINWLFLFIFFWFIITLISVLIWWSFMQQYSIMSFSGSGLVSSSNSSIKTTTWDWS